ncbi:MAG: nitroreductase family protein [Eubacteriales bacterium]|nr:nitroreductase family protein [Eubacteriales bacterium]
MNTQEAILARRSIRKFQADPISDDIIQALLTAAMAAPSACNKRPWEFYVVKNQELLEKLRLVSRYSNMDSPLNIIVAGNDKRSLNHKPNDFWIQDCAAATQNILLTATELGLGSCWCGLYPMVTTVKRVREILGLEDHIFPMALIHIGLPAEEQPPRSQYQENRVHVFA